MSNILRHIFGYLFGFMIFIFLFPSLFYLLARIDPLNNFISPENFPLRLTMALPFFLLGLIFIIWSNIYLFLIGKGGPFQGFKFEVSPITKKLVTVGPYRYSRNPMVFGTLTLYFSLGLFYASPVSLAVLFIFSLLITSYLKFSEEKRLLKDFGQEFIDYKNKVAMIIPFLKIKQ